VEINETATAGLAGKAGKTTQTDLSGTAAGSVFRILSNANLRPPTAGHEAMLEGKTGWIAALCFALLLVSEYSQARSQSACSQAQEELDAAKKSLNSAVGGGTARFDSALASVQKQCDVSNFVVGMKVVGAYEIQGDAPSIDRSLKLVEPHSPAEVQQLEMKKVDFYASRGLFEPATIAMQTLRAIPADLTSLQLAEAQMECRFGRCASKLDSLRHLTGRFPKDAQLRGLLGFSLADRQEFEEAAPQFDRALQLNLGALDEVTALVAVVTYCNVGQRTRAQSVYDVMSGDWGTFMGVSGETLRKMKAMIEDTSGKKYHFSSWPIETAPRK
jgi:hypothetical protein